MRRRAIPLLAVLGAAALLAAGCGGGGDGGDAASSEGQEYVDAIVASFNESSETGSTPISEDDARCAGEGFVETLGVDRLEEAGITPEQLRDADNLTAVVPDVTTEEADALVDVIYDCIDISGVFVAGFAESAGATLPDDTVECLAGNFENSERLREAFANSILTGEDPDFESDTSLITEILGDCMTIEELLELGQQASGE
jgi:hypothetical protein